MNARPVWRIAVLLIFAAALAASACGRKGPPVPPGEGEPEYRDEAT